MKAILVLFDSLARAYLPPYGNDWVQAPNFARLAQRSLTFDRCYVGSMPCMPARRELHTGRYNFLHRSWGPLEPFDDSMPELLKRNGVYTHLVSDHLHYGEDGGGTYHTRYGSWEVERGQQGDPWKGEVADPEIPPHLGVALRQDRVNRKYMQAESAMSQTRTFDRALEFVETNRDADDWFLQVECFDPHPPFFAAERFRALYPDDYDGPAFDYPRYAPRAEEETDEAVEHCRRRYAALVSQCDHSLGRILDAMERHDLWKNTMLVVTTDHGFLLGEHDWWAFVRPPFYDRVARKPLFMHDPRAPRPGERCDRLVQTHDLAPTLLEYFGVDRPPDMRAAVLRETIARDAPARDAGLFGVFGGHVNVTDGRYVYMRAPDPEKPLYNYTLMPMHMTRRFGGAELRSGREAPPFSFTKGARLMRYAAEPFMQDAAPFGHLLFDLEADPGQERPIAAPKVEARMRALLVREMRANDAPPELFGRLGLPG
ncbi:MAG: sulfatase [Planctomycetota bacterium]